MPPTFTLVPYLTLFRSPHPRQAPFNVVDALLYHRNTVCAGEHRAWETPDLNALRTKAADHCRRGLDLDSCPRPLDRHLRAAHRSEEHTSELQSLMRITYAVFCLKKKNPK